MSGPRDEAHGRPGRSPRGSRALATKRVRFEESESLTNRRLSTNNVDWNSKCPCKSDWFVHQRVQPTLRAQL
jgi:hypothetical protein